MKIGMQEIQNTIYKQLQQTNASIPGGRGKFSKDLAKKIYDLLEDEVNIDLKTMARGRGVSEQVISMCEKITDAFGFDVMPLTDSAIKTYEWVAEQEKQGQTIEVFVKWANSPERAQYIRMYRKDPASIKIDWSRAFTATDNKPKAEVI